MALVVIGALLSSTVLTLVVAPALYALLDDLQERAFGRKRRPFEAVGAVGGVATWGRVVPLARDRYCCFHGATQSD